MATKEKSPQLEIDRMTIEEIRKILEQNKLDVSGSRAVLQRRLRNFLDSDDGQKRDEEIDDDEEDEGEIEKTALKLPELKYRLRRLGLSVAGRKAELQKRLEEALRTSKTIDGDEQPRSQTARVIDGQSNIEDDEGTNGHQQRMRPERIEVTRPDGAVFSFRDVEEAIGTFSGDDGKNVRMWIRKFEDIAELCNWNTVQRAIYSKKLLRGSAKLFVAFEVGGGYSWVEMKEALQREFGAKLDSHTVHQRLRQWRKQPNETYNEY